MLPVDAKKLEEGIRRISREGSPNFFGFQRFGRDGDNAQQGKELVEGSRKVRNPKVRKLLLNAYQSDLFNRWLSKRILASMGSREFAAVTGFSADLVSLLQSQEQFFKVFPGDVMGHYPHGRIFHAEEPLEEARRFRERDVSVTGLIPGERDIRAEGIAREIEAPFDTVIPAAGDRRYAWIFPEFHESEYRPENAWFELAFTLPKGSYATVVIEELLHTPL